ncbi:hypothetical protein EXN61_03535 [Agrobacterium tumefaciens]|uniref:Uncharacterized protein n=1 Tax=Agrobacterium tumefaciens TaxID=358 RepID=A0A546Y7K4_AGRTU|nr:hypothetical protein EXN61_03535 [Agrobacterium tumefaciens]
MDPIADSPCFCRPSRRASLRTGEPVVHNVFAPLRVPSLWPQIPDAGRNSHLFCIFRDLFRL